MEKIKGFLNKKHSWILLGIIFLGIFLRVYNFAPWIHFELDQARDAILIDEAIDGGMGELTLLGPRAAGTMLRLGPAFYYLEYIGSVITGNTIVGSAGVVLFFSILSLPLFYVFLRRYFSERISLSLLAVFSTSLFLVTYSRFAWNPNLIPFFMLVVMYSLLRTVEAEEKKKGKWLVLTAVFFSLLVQFHFLALIISSGVAVLFLLYKRPKIQLKFWVAAVAVFFFVSSPMIINDIKTGGDNFSEFMGAVTEKSDESPVPLIEKLARNYSEHSFWHEVILTGYQDSDLPKLEKKKKGGYGVECDRYCRDHLVAGMLGFLIVTLGGILLIWRAFKEKHSIKKDFLVINLLVLFVSFVIFTPLSLDLSPRFFLIEIAIPFVFLGLIFENMKSIKGGKLLIAPAAAILVIFNISFVEIFFNELSVAGKENTEIGRDRILKQKTRITLEQQMAIIEYFKERYNENGYPIFLRGQNEFHRSFSYLLDKEGIFRDGISTTTIYEEGNYFLIVRSQSSMDSFQEKYGEKFEFTSKEEFGTLSVFGLSPKKDAITNKSFDLKELEKERDDEEDNGSEDAKRYKWNEIF
ncbi:MAG: glycosyltransferase family 39 protein [Candidatus Moranbacteria bacterium]|nr:glycosyltransferase family 39 protein [Candidatus Moranbacteria bacterium]